MKRPGSKVVKIDPLEEKEVVFWPESLVDEIKKNWPVDMRREGGFNWDVSSKG